MCPSSRSRWCCRAYLRYVDDFALFSDSKQQLAQWYFEIVEFLCGLRLTIHAESAQVNPVVQGIPWLGFVVYPTHRKLKRRNGVQFQRRLAHNISLYRQGAITFAELDAFVQGWIAHVAYGDTWGLRRQLGWGLFSPRPAEAPVSAVLARVLPEQRRPR